MLRIGVYFLCFFVSSALSYGQDGLREEKTSQIRKSIWIPIVYYTPETSLALGVLNITNFNSVAPGKSSQIISNLAVTLNSQVVASFSPKFYLSGGDYEAFGNLFFSYFPNRFYGVSNRATTSLDGEPYTENTLNINGGVARRIYLDFFARSSVGYEKRKLVEYDKGTLLDSIVASTGRNNLEVANLNIGLEWDTRSYPQSPISGAWYRGAVTWYSPKDADTGESLTPFSKIDFDFRRYISISSEFISATQLLISNMNGEKIPFQYLNSIGGNSRLRGFLAGRFRNKALSLLQTEIRYQFKEKWSSSVFLGTARLADDSEHISQAESLWAGGFGFQYLIDTENRTKLRLDLGFANSKPGVYFIVGEAF